MSKIIKNQRHQTSMIFLHCSCFFQRTLAYVTYEATTKSTTLRLKQFVIRECFFACGYVKNGKHHEGDRQKRVNYDIFNYENNRSIKSLFIVIIDRTL